MRNVAGSPAVCAGLMRLGGGPGLERGLRVPKAQGGAERRRVSGLRRQCAGVAS